VRGRDRSRAPTSHNSSRTLHIDGATRHLLARIMSARRDSPPRPQAFPSEVLRQHLSPLGRYDRYANIEIVLRRRWRATSVRSSSRQTSARISTTPSYGGWPRDRLPLRGRSTRRPTLQIPTHFYVLLFVVRRRDGRRSVCPISAGPASASPRLRTTRLKDGA
jgi:hypothetical protein